MAQRPKNAISSLPSPAAYYYLKRTAHSIRHLQIKSNRICNRKRSLRPPIPAMAASGEFFSHPMDGCLSGCDGIIDQRPYHRNCKCELHKNKSRKHNCPTGKKGSIVSYPIRRSWSEGCLALSSFSSPASSPGHTSSSPSAAPPIPAKMMKNHHHQQIHRQGSDSDDDDLFPQIQIKN